MHHKSESAINTLENRIQLWLELSVCIIYSSSSYFVNPGSIKQRFPNLGLRRTSDGLRIFLYFTVTEFKVSFSSFWAQQGDKPILTKFQTTYLCETGFSSLVTIKNKARNRLDPQNDLRCALSINIQPRFDQLVMKLEQHHGSH